MNFNYAIRQAKTEYDVTGDLEDLQEIGLIAYDKIGNKNTILKQVQLKVDCSNGSIQLPCDVSIIEAVTYCGEDYNYTSNVKQDGDPYSANVENYIESRKAFTNPYYISGKFVKYKRVGNTLYVNKGLDTVNLLYHANILDEDGLPDINDKEASAIAVYIAFTIKQKEAFKTHNQVIMQEAQSLRKRWLGLLDAARVPDYISQNEMNDILDAKYSWDRKVYNKSYKPM